MFKTVKLLWPKGKFQGADKLQFTAVTGTFFTMLVKDSACLN